MKKLFFITAFSIILTTVHGQNGQNRNSEETRAERNAEFKERPFVDRLAYGGDLSLQFGTYTYINLSPLIGYRLNPDFMMGFGLSYQYLAYRGIGYTNSTSIYGGRIFARQELGNMFFLHGEYEILNLESYSFASSNGRLNVDMACLGVGYKSLFGEFSYYYFMVLYDFIGNLNSPYPLSPLIFKAGFIFGK